MVIGCPLPSVIVAAPFRLFHSCCTPTSSSSASPLLPLRFLSSPTFSSAVVANGSSSLAVPSLDELKRKNVAKIKQLNAAITNFCADSFKQNRELRVRTRPIVAHLQKAICAPKGRSRLVQVGSIASGMAFDANNADIDLAFVYCGNNHKEQLRFLQDFSNTSFPFLRTFLEAIAGTLQEFCNDPAHSSDGFRISEPPCIIAHTAIPLINAKFDNGISFDISFPRVDFQALRNTLMVRHYVQCDHRFLPLFHWLRIVFQEMGLKNSKNGLFSSYQTLLLVLHFLSRKEVPDNVLPAFCDLPQTVRDTLFEPKLLNIIKDLEKITTQKNPSSPWKSKCAKSVGELAIELVDYYARFDPWTTAISIKHGRTTIIFRTPNPNIGRPSLKVMDPFSATSTTRSSVLGEALMVGFQFLHTQMATGRHMATFPELDGLAKEFLTHVRQQRLPWHIFLDKNCMDHVHDGDTGEGIEGEEEKWEKEAPTEKEKESEQ